MKFTFASGRGLGLASCGAIGFSPMGSGMFVAIRFAGGTLAIFSATFWSCAAAPPCPCVDLFGLPVPSAEMGRKASKHA